MRPVSALRRSARRSPRPRLGMRASCSARMCRPPVRRIRPLSSLQTHPRPRLPRARQGRRPTHHSHPYSPLIRCVLAAESPAYTLTFALAATGRFPAGPEGVAERTVPTDPLEVRRLIFESGLSLVEEMGRNPKSFSMDSESREMTVLFSDIRNFTNIAEALEPRELSQLMNEFLTPMTQIIHRNRGTIDKYMGDAIMAFWNAPLDDANHAANTCRAANEMVARVDELNRKWRKAAEATGVPFVPVVIGIGISSGECLVGNLGSDQRFDYSAIGDHLAIGAKGTGEHGTGTGFVFEYDPARKSLRLLADLAKTLNLPAGHYTRGKVHTRLDLGKSRISE